MRVTKKRFLVIFFFYEAPQARGYALEEDSAPQVKTCFAPAPPIVCFVIA